MSFCSFAVTGREVSFQAIFVCHACPYKLEPSHGSDNGDQDDAEDKDHENDVAQVTEVCVCEACADNCHKDHEGLEYIGMGPSYCDCHRLVLATTPPPAAAATPPTQVSYNSSNGGSGKKKRPRGAGDGIDAAHGNSSPRSGTGSAEFDARSNHSSGGDSSSRGSNSVNSSECLVVGNNSSICCCKLVQVSREEATRLGIEQGQISVPSELPAVASTATTNAKFQGRGKNNNNHNAKLHPPLGYAAAAAAVSDEEEDDDDNDSLQNDVDDMDNAELQGEISQSCDYIRDAYTIPVLLSNHPIDICERVRQEAIALVQLSRETFWLDPTQPDSELCALEWLARLVYHNHLHQYRDFLHLQSSSSSSSAAAATIPFAGGAEWWVQVKPVTVPDPNKDVLLEGYNNGAEAVDLHYDKDEALAESFGLGSFPALSTVTYLTDSWEAPPTIILPHRYDEGDGDVMGDMLVSRPAMAKHLVFDGRLLHGCPSHYALRPLPEEQEQRRKQQQQQPSVAPAPNGMRITFLVNLWTRHKPSGVQVLSNDIRQSILRSCATGAAANVAAMTTSNPASLSLFEPRPRAEFILEDEEELPEQLRGRIQIPFLSKGTTWDTYDKDGKKTSATSIDCTTGEVANVEEPSRPYETNHRVEEEEEDAGPSMLVTTFPPPPKFDDKDTLLVRFGPGLQAYFDYSSSLEENSSVASSSVGVGDHGGGGVVANGANLTFLPGEEMYVEENRIPSKEILSQDAFV